jgi:hypothetical protein
MAVLSLANVLWSLLILFFMIVYFIMLYQVIIDLFHRHDVSGAKKAAWFVFWLVVPIISLISYLYTHGDGIAQRTFDRTAMGQAALDTYDRPADHNRSAAAQIEHSKRLLESGAIGQEEYDKLKAHALEYRA